MSIWALEPPFSRPETLVILVSGARKPGRTRLVAVGGRGFGAGCGGGAAEEIDDPEHIPDQVSSTQGKGGCRSHVHLAACGSRAEDPEFFPSYQ